MSYMFMHKELKLITGCFTSSKPTPSQKPCTLHTQKTKRRHKGPSVSVLHSDAQGAVYCETGK